MRLLKLYIDNFKGVASPTVIDFEKDINILKGPNGFGKTTIFDALELCITGEIYRTKVYENVTEDRTDYSDAFYRNKKSKDMILNLLVEDHDNKRITIVKILSASSTGRADESIGTKRYKTSEWGILDTYLVSEADFGEPTTATLSDKLSQGDIELAILGKDGGSLIDLYRLFAYLQQAENTFYLKKTERNRKAELDHLFRTDSEAEVLKGLTDRSTLLSRWSSALDGKIKSLGEINEEGGEVEYVKLFDDEDFKYDSVHPYSNVLMEHIDETHNKYRASVNEIESFLIDFDPEVYKKDKTKQNIFQLAKSDHFLDYIVLGELVEDDAYNKLRRLSNLKTYMDSSHFLRYFILQNFLTDVALESYINSTKYFTIYTEYMSSSDRPITVEGKLKLIDSWYEGISDQDSEKVKKYLGELSVLNERLDETQSTVSDLVEIRQSMNEAFSKVPINHSIDETCECPFCGFDWKNISELTKSINSKSNKFDVFLQSQTKLLTELKKKIENDFLNNFDKQIEKYLNDNKSPYNFLQVLNSIRTTPGYANFSSYADLLKEIAKESESIIWTDFKSADALATDTSELIALSKPSLSVDKDVFDRITALVGYKYDESVEFINDRKLEIGSSWTLESLGNINELNSRIDDLRSLLMKDAQSIEIDSEKLAGNLVYMFKDYFQEDAKKLASALLKIKSKLSYLDSEYQNNRRRAYRVLADRLKKLNKIKDLTKDTKSKYENELKKYKREMIEKIQLPFYVYTAKILQNYQQGMGVFIASPKNNSDAIRFVTESESNHDIVHHLSSGQLAVVSIAFTLAINKVYGDTSLKILAIDDPVYEMDGLNVFSFVELLRRSFINDYQIILSTHDDDSALYMKYRFEKVKDNSVATIDVQDIFFTPNIK